MIAAAVGAVVAAKALRVCCSARESGGRPAGKLSFPPSRARALRAASLGEHLSRTWRLPAAQSLDHQPGAIQPREQQQVLKRIKQKYSDQGVRAKKPRWRLHTPPAGGKRRRATKGQCPNTVRGRDPLCARSWEPDFGACLPKHQSRTPDSLQRRRKFVFLVFVSVCQGGTRVPTGREAKGGRNARRT